MHTKVYAASGNPLVEISRTPIVPDAKAKKFRLQLGTTLSSEWIYAFKAREWSQRYLLIVPAVLDLKNITGYSMGKLFIQGLALKEDSNFISAQTSLDDIHAHSNVIAGEDRLSLYELYWEKDWDGILARFGKVDANDHFAVSETMGHFMNGGAGFSPSIYGLPSYPDATWSAQLWTQGSLVDWGFGVFDGGATQLNFIPTGKRILPSEAVLDGSLFLVSQANFHWSLKRSQSTKKGLPASKSISESTSKSTSKSASAIATDFYLDLGYWGHTGASRSTEISVNPSSNRNESTQGGFATFDCKIDHLGESQLLLGLQMSYSQLHTELPNTHYAVAMVWMDWWKKVYGKSVGVEFSRVGFDELKSSDQTSNIRSEQAEYLMEYTMEFEFVEWMSLHMSYTYIWNMALRGEQESLWFTRVVLGQDALLSW